MVRRGFSCVAYYPPTSPSVRRRERLSATSSHGTSQMAPLEREALEECSGASQIFSRTRTSCVVLDPQNQVTQLSR
jgi:hypothetical protein